MLLKRVHVKIVDHARESLKMVDRVSKIDAAQDKSFNKMAHVNNAQISIYQDLVELYVDKNVKKLFVIQMK